MPILSRALFFMLLVGVSMPSLGKTPENGMPKRLSDAAAAADRGDCDTALRLIAAELKHDTGLSDGLRSAVFETGADCAFKSNKPDLAYHYALAATKLDRSSDWMWRYRLGLEIEADTGAAVSTVEAMANGRGAALNGVPIRWLFSLDRKLVDKHDSAARLRLMSVLTSTGYQPEQVVPVVDVFRQNQAELLFEAGDKDGAARVVAQIENPTILMEVSVDQRLRNMLPASFDSRAAVQVHLNKMRDIAQYHPDSLGLVVEIAASQRRLGDAAGALATLRAADPTGPNAKPYADMDDQINWWWDGVGRSQVALGHYAEAVAAFQSGIGVQENGGLNVSQTINLAAAQVRFGHASDALVTLAPLDNPAAPMSPYGQMEMRLARGWAAIQNGKAADADADIAYAKAHDGDHPQALTDLLLCAGDLDGAAAALTARLDDPDRRVQALFELSDYAASAATLPEGPVNSQLRAVKARADVQAAIARAGGIRHFDVQAGEL